MALILADGLDHYNTSAEAAVMWNAGANLNPSGSGATFSISPTYARFTGNGIRMVTGIGVGQQLFQTFANTATAFFSCAFYLKQLISVSTTLLQFGDGGSQQVVFEMTSSGQIIILRNNTVLATSASGISPNVWHRVEFQVHINSSTGFAECVVDGVSLVSFTGNTQNTANAQINEMWWGATSGNFSSFEVWYDDVLLYTGSGAAPNGYLGDCKCLTQFPSANGSTNNYTQNAASWAASTVEVIGNQVIDSNGNLQRVSAITSDAKTGGSAPSWSTGALGSTTSDNHVTWTLIQKATLSNFNFVNEVPPDGDNSYLSDSTVSDEELYSFPALAGATTIYGIAVVLYARKDDAGTRTLETLCSSSGTPANSGSFPLSSTYAFYEGFFPTDPNTSTTWTQSGVNAAQFGVETTA